MVFPSYNEVDNDLYEYLCQINATELHLDHYYSYSDMYDMLICINNQVQWHVFPLNATEEDPNDEQYMLPLGFIPTDNIKSTFKATIH